MATRAKFIQNLEARLHEQKRSLERVTVALLEQGREVQTTDVADMADHATLSYQKEMLFRQGTQGRSHLALVQRALERIADGSFGDCLSCGKPIGMKRLEALPWTPRCIDCQERVERGEMDDPGRAA